MFEQHLSSNNWQRNKILQSKEHQLLAYEKINELIVESRYKKRIVLSDGTALVEYLSCSYLGLDQDPRVVKASINRLEQTGVNFAVSRTRMRMKDMVVLEDLLNKIFCNGFSTVFSSLHVAHLGMIPMISSGELPSFPVKANGVLFIVDKIAHASIQINRGLMEQLAETVIADFKNVVELEAQFKYAEETGRTPIALSDGVCSMGGLTPVNKLIQLAEQYDGYLYLDDAHGTSVFGESGCGYVLETLDGFHPRLILAASLSKGFGTNGGVIVMPTHADELMVKRFCSTYIFGNPLSLAVVAESIESAKIHLSKELKELQGKLKNNADYFDSLIHEDAAIINFKSCSPVRGIFIGDEFKAINITLKLRNIGIAVSAAMYPTVAKGQSILRITISADHEPQEIKKLCDFINNEVI